MSQSDVHRQLVVAVAQAIQQRYPTIHVMTDLLNAPGDQIPPIIGGFRPDVIARSNSEPMRLVIAEAKTDGDIDNRHTLSQINAFVNHLDAIPSGNSSLVLAVNGRAADLARTVLRFACRDRVSSRLGVKLFDGLDFWSLGPIGAPLWRLS